jgi:hypothetical protein
MSANYGLGIVDFVMEADASREEKLDALIAVAKVAGITVRDAFDGEAFEVTAKGDVKQLEGTLAKKILDAVKKNGGSASYSSMDLLDGYVLCLDGAEEGEVELPGGNDTYVGPLDPFVERLEDLLERNDLDDSKQSLHKSLRKLCDVSRKLKIPVNVGS